ncbi:MAG TPA: ribose-phosphate diphosphokinase [Gammaproteobacteria bacterium]|nr:ribose-phosphate diphosphokinase [Gammaproteobacteria bacterium]
MQLYACDGNASLASRLSSELEAERGAVTWHRFPDGETLVRVDTPPSKDVAVLCTLADADARMMPLLLTVAALRAQGAARVGLIAPYLAYMRQDKAFHPGEAVAARHFGALLGERFDWLVTVDPHLHRIRDLGEIMSCSSRRLHAAPLLADWIRGNVSDPVLVGPDGESAQWVSAAADSIGAGWFNLDKQRLGDLEVKVTMPEGIAPSARTAVLVDDIVSSGRTLVAAAAALKQRGFQNIQCVAVHGLFSGDCREILRQAGIGGVTVTNSILQPESRIDLAALLAAGVRDLGVC